LVGLTLFCVFVGSIIYSFVNWKKDDAERVSNELEKLRDGVVSEVKRLTAEWQMEMQAKVTEQLEKIKRLWTEELEAFSETHGKEKQRVAEAERQQIRDRLRLLEQKKRELAAVQASTHQVRQKTLQLLQDCLRTLKSA
jgi:transketolase